MKHDKTQPPIQAPQAIEIPLPEICTLGNGVKLYALDCSEQDVIRFSFVFRAGTAVQHVPFSASSVANLLSEGSSQHSAQEIAEMLDYHGSYFDVSLDRDYAVINFVSLLKYFPQTLEIAREIVLMPAFSQEEIAVYCEKRKQRLAVERSKVSTKARELFTSSLFGTDHPYGVSYDESYYDKLTREDIVSFFKERYTAENCFVVCSGKIGGRQRDMLAALASQLPGGGGGDGFVFPPARSVSFVFGEHEGAVQSAIRMGTLLFPRTHPDFIAMQVVSTVLGGYFGSRLVRNLREEHGYTYGAFSTMVNLEHAGYLAIATEVATEVTQDAVTQILAEIDLMRTEPVADDELQMVKNIMTGEVMRVLDGPFGIADVTIENVSNSTGNDYNDRWLEEVRGITPERVLEMARKYLDPAKFTTVIVGNPSQKELFGAFLQESTKK